MCVRMFEPSENTLLGTFTISIGVETVQGTAGIVYSDAYYITIYCILFGPQMEMTTQK